ncbi:hypothetical protein FLA_5162 [Filimonas lacunae]|nr:hypothetical protein FLA_5162 [Filimonas lacunae]
MHTQPGSEITRSFLYKQAQLFPPLLMDIAGMQYRENDKVQLCDYTFGGLKLQGSRYFHKQTDAITGLDIWLTGHRLTIF